jgi:[ribosomal protein S5]-alanine N-acetyltransferase
MANTAHSSATVRNPTPARRLPIETASLKLRALVPQDAPKAFQMSQEEGMRTWLPSQVYRDEAHAAAVLAFLISQYSIPADPRIGPYVLAVQLASADDMIGHVGFSPLGDAVEVGFAIERAHQGKGIATEAVLTACEWAADAFTVGTLVGVTSAQNKASQSVLLRAGFTRLKEKVMRFQGSEQRVIFFAFARTTHRPYAAGKA